MGSYSVISHTADTAMVVHARDLDDLFATGTRAMFEIMYGLVVPGLPTLSRDIQASGGTKAELLWDWLSAVLGWAEADGAAYFDVRVSVGEGATGSVMGPESSGLALVGPPIKAVTLHQLEIVPENGGWKARVIFDV